MEKGPIIKLEHVTVRYRRSDKDALSDFNLELHPGEFICVLGKSGAGKSTMIRCLNGLHMPTGGSVNFLGEDITKLNESALRKVRTNMGMIFQHFNLIPRLSVMQNVLTGTFGKRNDLKNLIGYFSKVEKEEALRAISSVELTDHQYKRVEHLSGGQKQRVAIARALLQKPKVFLGDEPVASLDPGTANRIFNLIQRIHKKHELVTLINVHDVTLAKRYATRVLALKDGKLIYDGPPDGVSEEWLSRIYDE
ncbi:phosphonate ABC transporter ATP-binding protein [Alkalihalobacillus sp. TS-13]|uniref:phosphonate ABC transporter ATP-binding protein n=1 Tax=Alkalihalobacillus sp. TS-13 TaxID=2842455 RepID=UPI0021AAE46F|nr:phosphonate ABC transporter ATP-binding protein [Alkalihalobacillus sp. TS-13]